MGYRINYQIAEKAERRKHPLRLPLLTVFSFLLFLWLVNSNWQEGTDYLQRKAETLKEYTAAVLNEFADGFLEGEPLSTVFSDVYQRFAP